MTTGLDTTLGAIDRALADGPGRPAGAEPPCQQCGHPLGVDGPDADFCSEDCHTTWHAARAAEPPTGAGTVPNEELPETPPVRALTWLGPTPPDARPGHELLDAVAAFVARFSSFPDDHCAPTLALWYAHTWIVDRFYVTPRLILDSAEPGSGKTRVLEVAQYLVAAPEMTISATTPALFRLVAAGPVTILFDEVDAIFNTKGGANEDLRGLLNAGYKRSATVARCVGDAKAMKVERFPVYAPAALAGIAGGMPATITTRAITIHMRRRRADEPVESFRERAVAREARPLREGLAAWLTRHGDEIADRVPAMPDGVTDRPAEIWEPLLAIADQAGGHWPETARAACVHFAHRPQHTSLGVRLLADLHAIYAATRTDRMTTAELLTALTALDDAPWADLHGKPLDSRGLGRLLARYGVAPRNLRVNGAVSKGYRIEDGLADAWSRYLPQAATSATGATSQLSHVADTNPLPATSATPPPPVADVADSRPPPATPLTSDVAPVADVADSGEGT